MVKKIYNSRHKEAGLNMFDALLLDRVESSGGNQSEFEGKHDITKGMVTRWIKGAVSPYKARRKNRDALQEALGYKMDALKKLGGVGVEQACEIVLDHIEREERKYKSTSPSIDHN